MNASRLTEVWTSKHGSIREFDPVQAAADYYLLESIANDVPFASLRRQPVVKAIDDEVIAEQIGISTASLEKWSKIRNRLVKPDKVAEMLAQAKLMFAAHVEYCDDNLVPYFHMAIGGELRHHKAVGYDKILSGIRDHAWYGWFSIYDAVGDQVYLDAAELFREFEGGSYGGDAWAVPCEIFHQRLTDAFGEGLVGKQIFVDRAWTLEHNGGCFLNKVAWSTKSGNQAGGLAAMPSILNAQASDPTDYPKMMEAASNEVKNLFRAYWKESRRQLEEDGFNLNTPEGQFMHNQQPRILCLHCGSNPNLGHMARCEWVLSSDREDSPAVMIEPLDFSLYSFDNWHATDSGNLEFTSEGKIRNYDESDRFTMRFFVKTQLEQVGTWKWEGLVSDFLGDTSFSVGLITMAMGDAGLQEGLFDGTLELFVRYRRAGKDDSYGELHKISLADLGVCDPSDHFRMKDTPVGRILYNAFT